MAGVNPACGLPNIGRSRQTCTQKHASICLVGLKRATSRLDPSESSLSHKPLESIRWHRHNSPNITTSPVAAAAIRGVLSWCTGCLLDVRRTDLCFDVGMRYNAWRTSRISPCSSVCSKKLWGAMSWIVSPSLGSLSPRSGQPRKNGRAVNNQ